MTPSDIPRALRRLVRERANGRCEYCLTPERISGLSSDVDHIIPLAAGGATDTDNLCLACASCNAFKGTKTRAVDPESRQEVALFDPRRQVWTEHFAWNEDNTIIVGHTACGRATVKALQMNNRFVVVARSFWAGAGWRPS
ncbi:MAG: HNH endonuclease signature motif containing protein [Chloroflexi bacterium]|nr:HNH endonuclease signature motif containing protein [Chloroflexota bacterium]